MQFDRILVPLDTSGLAEAALGYAYPICPAGGVLRLVGVIDIVGEGLLAPTPNALAALLPERKQAYEAYLEQVASRMRTGGWQVDFELREGRAMEILAAAEEFEADLILMASHGHGGLRRWLLGSVADRVLRTSPRPVLILAPVELRAGMGEPLRRLLVPLDGSPLAEEAIAPAAALAARTGATVVLARVEPSVLALHQGGWIVPDFTVDAKPVIASAQQYLAYVRQRLPDEAAVELVVLKGDVAQTLTEYARTCGIDLIVMTSHGHGGLGRALLGSVADQVVRAGNPVLLIPEATREDALEARSPAPAAFAGERR